MNVEPLESLYDKCFPSFSDLSISIFFEIRAMQFQILGTQFIRFPLTLGQL